MLSIDRGLSSAPAALQGGAAVDAGAPDQGPATFGDLFLQAIEGPGTGALTDANADASCVAPRRFPRGAADESSDGGPVVKEPAADEGPELLAFLVAPDSTPSIASIPWLALEASADRSVPPSSAPSHALVDQPSYGDRPSYGGGIGDQVLPAPVGLVLRDESVAPEQSSDDGGVIGDGSPEVDQPLPALHAPAALIGSAPTTAGKARETNLSAAGVNQTVVSPEAQRAAELPQQPHAPPDHEAPSIAMKAETRAVPQVDRGARGSIGSRPTAAPMPPIVNEEATPIAPPVLNPRAAEESSRAAVEPPPTEAKVAAASPINPHLLSRIATEAGTALDANQAPALSGPALGQTLAAATPPAADDVIGSQIVRSLRFVAQDGGGEARVRLKPEYLGEVLILLKVDQGGVTASLQAESPAVRHWAETHEHVLRQGLGAHGLRLDQFTVQDTTEASTSERRSDDGPANQQDRQPPPRKARPDAERKTERFEVVL